MKIDKIHITSDTSTYEKGDVLTSLYEANIDHTLSIDQNGYVVTFTHPVEYVILPNDIRNQAHSEFIESDSN